MFHLKSSDLLHLTAKSLYPFTNLSLCPQPPAPGNYFSILYFYDFYLKKKINPHICDTMWY